MLEPHTLIVDDQELTWDPPVTVGDCYEAWPGPCPWVSCQYHLLWAHPLMVRKIRLEKISDDAVVDFIEAMPETCVLRMAARDGMNLQEIGLVLGMTRERIRQLIDPANRDVGVMRRLRHPARRRLLADFEDMLYRKRLSAGGVYHFDLWRTACDEDKGV
jgi:hypothetical protein